MTYFGTTSCVLMKSYLRYSSHQQRRTIQHSTGIIRSHSMFRSFVQALGRDGGVGSPDGSPGRLLLQYGRSLAGRQVSEMAEPRVAVLVRAVGAGYASSPQPPGGLPHDTPGARLTGSAAG